MSATLRIRRVIVLLAVLLLIAVVAFSGFSVMEMASMSMEPLITGRGSPPSHVGDLVVFAKWFSLDSLRAGNLVVVSIPTPDGRVLTVRTVERQPDTPTGHVYVRSAKDSGIDSRQLGPLSGSHIHGRVVWVIR